MLNPTHESPKRMTHWQETWSTSAHVRIEHAFEDEALLSIAQAVPQLTYTMEQSTPPKHTHQYWKSMIDQHWDPFQPFTTLWTWLNGEGLEWFEAVTQRQLESPQPKSLSAIRYTSGCFLHPTPCDAVSKKILFVLGLSTVSGAHEQGGHIRFKTRDDTLVHTHPIQYNTLDIFDLSVLTHQPEVTKFTGKQHQYAVFGWLHARDL